MPHFQSIPGSRLAEILIAAGWEIEWGPRNSTVGLKKKGHQSIQITMNFMASQKRVTAICENNAKLSTDEFDQYFRTAPAVAALHPKKSSATESGAA